jgi:hypothetical protein
MNDPSAPGPSNPILADADLYTEAQVCAFRGVKVHALRNERANGGGPPFIKVSRRIYYPRAAFHAWLRKQMVHPAPKSTLTSAAQP